MLCVTYKPFMLNVAMLSVVASYAEHHETFTPVTSPLGNDISLVYFIMEVEYLLWYSTLEVGSSLACMY
jgi:hypothetical protein